MAEPEIRKESGNRISVAVAGENDPQRVFDLVGSTGKLYFIDLEQGLTEGVSRSVVEGGGVTPKNSLYELLKAAEPRPSATASPSCSRSRRARPTSP